MTAPSETQAVAPAATSIDADQPAAGEAALRDVVSREYAAVWRFLRRLGVPESDADDAAQRVFARVLAKESELQPGSERAYLMRAAFRAALEEQRSRQRKRSRDGELDVDTLASELPQPDEAVAQRQELELLDYALSALPTEFRAVFTLFEIEGLTFTEIAVALELPRGTVASRVRRARELFTNAVRRQQQRRQRR